MRYLSQRDQRWSQLRLGASTLTVGRFGCTTTCISMLSDYFNCYKSPETLSKQQDLYTDKNHPQGEGLIIWKALDFHRMRFAGRKYGRDDAAIKAALKATNKAVIFQVNHGAHWVVGVRPTLFGNDYVCVDPWDGKKKNVIATYGNINGCAFFEAK